jgi:hypothetical protein
MVGLQRRGRDRRAGAPSFRSGAPSGEPGFDRGLRLASEGHRHLPAEAQAGGVVFVVFLGAEEDEGGPLDSLVK